MSNNVKHVAKNDLLAIIKGMPESERKAFKKHTVLNKVWEKSERKGDKRIQKGSFTIQFGSEAQKRSHTIEFVLTQTLQKGDADHVLVITDTTLNKTATFQGSETSTMASVDLIVPGAATGLELHPDGTYSVQGVVCATADDAAASILAVPENQSGLTPGIMSALHEVFTDMSTGAAIVSKGNFFLAILAFIFEVVAGVLIGIAYS